MSQLEAQMTAEIIAAHLLSEPLEPDKLSFLREHTAELLTFFDEQCQAVEKAA